MRDRVPWVNLALFLATVASTFYVGADMAGETGHPLRGWTFAVPLLAILVTHEFGHWIQARRHQVEASLPYFIPFPWGLLGTFGAVISMRGRIRTRDALLDIGASGPLAGMVVAIPVLVFGLHLSKVMPIPEHGLDEGQSLFYLAVKRIVVGPIPDGHDVFLHPTAFAGWTGLLLTMLNLLPIGQLDGGHVAYSIFGPKQDRYSRIAHHSLLVVAAIVGMYWGIKALRAHASRSDVLWAFAEGKNWIFWWILLFFLTRGNDHPPTQDGELSRKRKWVAWATLALFVLLFMPVPFRVH
ncbi:MAG: site-2 protease family protein [Deltaproteobacteria bacterium]|nr:site-2 protease family protein [Deltaproteobacteria bacterium]